jgi:ABC-type lipoprotein export system ATPase subunit
MSGGECQRAAVVRALVNKPSMILADEPTGALDESNAEMIGNLLVTICKEEKITLVTVTHSANLAAKMNRVFHLRNGILIS